MIISLSIANPKMYHPRPPFSYLSTKENLILTDGWDKQSKQEQDSHFGYCTTHSTTLDNTFTTGAIQKGQLGS